MSTRHLPVLSRALTPHRHRRPLRRGRLLLLVSALMVLGSPVAASQAYGFSFRTLEVVPETATHTNPVGLQALTAVLSDEATIESGPIRVLFEATGANDDNGNSPNSPDASCYVAPGTDSCLAVVVGFGRAGNMLVRAWVDSDGHQTSNRCGEVDCQEGRYAGPTDCLLSHQLFRDPDDACPPDGVATEGATAEPDHTDVVEVAWATQPTQVNRRPDCSSASADPSRLTVRDGAFRAVTVGGATDPDGDAVRVTAAGVTQDEPLGTTSPDARRTPSAEVVELRDERDGKGDGRVYRIAFSASDGRGGTCSGTARVAVPHDSKRDAVESELVVDSFGS